MMFHEIDGKISIHAPREGGDLLSQSGPLNYSIFQSTPPARGATRGPSTTISSSIHFNPRPPRGGRLP